MQNEVDNEMKQILTLRVGERIQSPLGKLVGVDIWRDI